MKTNFAARINQLSRIAILLIVTGATVTSHAETIKHESASLLDIGSYDATGRDAEPQPTAVQVDASVPHPNGAVSSGVETDGQKSWIVGAKPNIDITVYPNDSRVHFDIYTGWKPSNAYNICGLDVPSPTMNITYSRDGTTLLIQNGISAQNGTLVNTSRGQECRVRMQLSTTNNSSVNAPRPGTYSISVTTTNGTGTRSYPYNACTNSTIYPNTPMYRVYNGQFTDYYYSSVLSEITAAETYAGYSGRVTAYQAPKVFTDVSKPWLVFFGPAPWLEHYYTANAVNGQFAVNAGYVAEGTDGFVYTTQVLGTVPLYQFSQYFASTGDLMHHYSKSSTPPAGMSFEEIAGYVCP